MSIYFQHSNKNLVYYHHDNLNFSVHSLLYFTLVLDSTSFASEPEANLKSGLNPLDMRLCQALLSHYFLPYFLGGPDTQVKTNQANVLITNSTLRLQYS